VKITFQKDYTVKDAAGTVYKKDKTYDLDDRSAAHFLNRKVAVLAEGEGAEPNQPQPIDDGLTPAAVRKLHRAELDELAKERGIDLADLNVPDSREHLISELGLTDEAE
jgi:hypothetical protein